VKGRDNLGDMGIDRMIILKYMFARVSEGVKWIQTVLDRIGPSSEIL
jgi:hypothetical protein